MLVTDSTLPPGQLVSFTMPGQKVSYQGRRSWLRRRLFPRVLAVCAGGIRGGHLRKLFFARVLGPTDQQKRLVPRRVSNPLLREPNVRRVDVDSDVPSAHGFAYGASGAGADEGVEDNFAREATDGGVGV
jgi:hypothetical protein